MAERTDPAGRPDPADRPVSTPRMIWMLYASRIRSQATFRTSFLADVLGQLLVVGIEFLELWVILTRVGTLGGMTLAQVTVVYGLGALAFGLADMLFGETDSLSAAIRSGKLETLLLRPVPMLLQISSLDLSLRRIGRIGVGLVMYVAALVVADFSPRPETLLLAVIAPLAGAAIFGGLFVLAGALQFWLIDGREFANAFTYGGNYVATTPGAVFALPLRAFFTFVIPATLVAYAPTLVLLDLPGPALIPTSAGWAGAPAAVLVWILAAVLWRAGVRRYTGAGG
ncbi:ABC-2 family transporter protein [Brachybacterium sp. J144]|uniref:ABC transporter permease n=1 Tax=Brachybacterium sp. J144 TaxID=3116487 RepID=UPI002E76239E|nr:ABC-2 family transporter protein [Brachybacterium sp. J144]MEE1651754.1 ABC-2 family transporter protein [Brachybacterium sp. J144]